MSTHAPDIVVRRLPLYLRALTLLADRGQEIISSRELGRRVGVSAAQLRKDLSLFGEFGRQGLGYEVVYLRDQIRRILQVDRIWHVALIGAGALGHALVNYPTFTRWDFFINTVFDNDPAKIGTIIGGLTVRSMDRLGKTLQAQHIEIAILAVPADVAQQVADDLVEAGIKALLNYAPISLVLPDDVHVSHIDPVASLQAVTYYL